MLLGTYYAKNYAGIIGRGLIGSLRSRVYLSKNAIEVLKMAVIVAVFILYMLLRGIVLRSVCTCFVVLCLIIVCKCKLY